VQSSIQSPLDNLQPAIRNLQWLFVWTGAALFLLSLLWFLYCYVRVYGRVDVQGAAWRPILVDVCLFSIFALHHSLCARTGVKRVVERLVPTALERSVYTWIASLLFLATCTWWQAVPGVLYELGASWSVLGYGVQLAGLALTISASRALGVLDLAGVRPFLLAGRGHSRPHVPLETRGLYGFVRHPLYFAWTLFVFGSPVMTGTRAVFAIVSTAYLAMAIPWEERSLRDTFGDEYEAYSKRVRWRMLPGIY
jgi:protein-S-isoprenylcysteine O-methyltransferase Ste14